MSTTTNVLLITTKLVDWEVDLKKPEKSPDLEEILEHIFSDKFTDLHSKLQSVVKEANTKYLYWDKFKYTALPEGTRPEEAWAVLKFMRQMQLKPIPYSDLPFNYWVPDTALRELLFIDQNASGQILVEEPIHADEKGRYIMRSIVEEAITSSQIEGAATTRAVAKEMLRSGRKPEDYAEKMIYNNYRTINKIKELIDKPLTPELIREIHENVTRGTLEGPSQEGMFRTEPVEVFDMDGQTILHTPPAASTIEGSIEKLCEFANKEGEDFIHPVVKAISLHFWLAYLHPFMDGNGRTARALFYWYILKKKYWLFEYLSISSSILKKRTQYYRAFLYSEMENDITYFIVFHLLAIRDAVDEIRLYLERKQREAQNAMRFLRKYPALNHRQRALLASALEHSDETYTFGLHARVHGIVYETARSDILALHKMELLDRRKEGKKYIFKPAEDLQVKLESLA